MYLNTFLLAINYRENALEMSSIFDKPNAIDKIREKGIDIDEIRIGDNTFSGKATFKIFVEQTLNDNIKTARHILIQDRGVEHRIEFKQGIVLNGINISKEL